MRRLTLALVLSLAACGGSSATDTPKPAAPTVAAGAKAQPRDADTSITERYLWDHGLLCPLDRVTGSGSLLFIRLPGERRWLRTSSRSAQRSRHCRFLPPLPIRER